MGRRITGALGNRPGAWAAAALLVLAAALFAVLELSRPHVDGDRLRLDTFYGYIDDGRIRSAEILDQDSYVVGDYDAGSGAVAEYAVALPSEGLERKDTIDRLVENDVPTEINDQFLKGFREEALMIIPSLMVVVVIIYFVVSMARGTGLFGSGSGARRVSSSERRASFGEIGGASEAIEELAEVRQYLEDPERFARMGARIPRGYLLTGPPGCGKTLLARALAGDTGAAFFAISGPSFTELYVGVGAARVRDLFEEAREHAPAIVFIDEIDAIGARRGASQDGHREREQTLNQILIELDGFDERSGVIVMAATNRADILDPALVRPGRFDRRIALSLPDRAARREILAVHAAGKPIGPDVDLDRVAAITRGFSGADLANVLNESTLLAARRGQPVVSMHLVEEGIDRVSMGISRAHLLSDDERRVIAYHEAGHALVGRALAGGSVPHKLSILSRGRTLGSVHYEAEKQDRVLYSRSALVDRMATMLGGRASEEIVYGEAGSGSADDLAQVAELARHMVRDWGMSEAVGALGLTADGAEQGPGGGYSDETARLIDAEIRRVVEEAEARARDILVRSRAALDAVAAGLIERETLSMSEVEEILGRTPAPA